MDIRSPKIRALQLILPFLLFYASHSNAQDTEISFEEFKKAIEFPLVYEEDSNHLSVSISAFKENSIFITDLVGIQLQKYEYAGFSQEWPRMIWNVYTVKYNGDPPPYNTAFDGVVPELVECRYSADTGLMIMTNVNPKEDLFYLTSYSVNGKNVSAIKIRESANEFTYNEKIISHEIPTPEISLQNNVVVGKHDFILQEKVIFYKNQE